MLRWIDHLVVVVPDLAAAAKSYAALGFSVVPGGRHPVGTHNQLIADTAALRRAGVAIDDPAPLSRKRPDGFQLAWVLSIPRPPHRGVAPFLIKDETPRAERIPRETTHANGVTGVGTLTVAVEAAAPARRWYAGVLGQPGREVERHELDAAGARVAGGPHALELVAPKGAGAASLNEWLRQRGAAPPPAPPPPPRPRARPPRQRRSPR